MTPDKMKQAFEQCLAALVENAPYDMAIELTNTRKSKKGGPEGVGRGSTFSHLRWMCLAGCGFVDAGLHRLRDGRTAARGAQPLWCLLRAVEKGAR